MYLSWEDDPEDGKARPRTRFQALDSPPSFGSLGSLLPLHQSHPIVIPEFVHLRNITDLSI